MNSVWRYTQSLTTYRQKRKKSAAATRTESVTKKHIVEEIHADPMDSPLTKMLE